MNSRDFPPSISFLKLVQSVQFEKISGICQYIRETKLTFLVGHQTLKWEVLYSLLTKVLVSGYYFLTNFANQKVEKVFRTTEFNLFWPKAMSIPHYDWQVWADCVKESVWIVLITHLRWCEGRSNSINF